MSQMLSVFFVVKDGVAFVRSDRESLEQPRRRGRKPSRRRRDYDDFGQMGMWMPVYDPRTGRLLSDHFDDRIEPCHELPKRERRQLDPEIREKLTAKENGSFDHIVVDGPDSEDFGINTDPMFTDDLHEDGYTRRKDRKRHHSWKRQTKACKPWARHKRRALRRNFDKVKATFTWHEDVLRWMAEDDERERAYWDQVARESKYDTRDLESSRLTREEKTRMDSFREERELDDDYAWESEPRSWHPNQQVVDEDDIDEADDFEVDFEDGVDGVDEIDEADDFEIESDDDLDDVDEIPYWHGLDGAYDDLYDDDLFYAYDSDDRYQYEADLDREESEPYDEDEELDSEECLTALEEQAYVYNPLRKRCKVIVKAPDAEEAFKDRPETEKYPTRLDLTTWKWSSRTRKQWGRHPRRLSMHLLNGQRVSPDEVVALPPANWQHPHLDRCEDGDWFEHDLGLELSEWDRVSERLQKPFDPSGAGITRGAMRHTEFFGERKFFAGGLSLPFCTEECKWCGSCSNDGVYEGEPHDDWRQEVSKFSAVRWGAWDDILSAEAREWLKLSREREERAA